MKAKKTFKSCIILLMLVLLSAPAFSASWYEWLYGGALSSTTHGNPVLHWYNVSQWELDVCYAWGGTSDPNSVSQNNVVGDYYHNLIVTIQAEVSDPLGEAAVATGKRVYEVAWFIQPTDLDETMNFEVNLIDQYGQKELVESLSSNYVNGFRGYDVRVSEKNYTNATITYWNDRREKLSMGVPFVR
jgi:hypothetical protein